MGRGGAHDLVDYGGVGEEVANVGLDGGIVHHVLHLSGEGKVSWWVDRTREKPVAPCWDRAG